MTSLLDTCIIFPSACYALVLKRSHIQLGVLTVISEETLIRKECKRIWPFCMLGDWWRLF